MSENPQQKNDTKYIIIAAVIIAVAIIATPFIKHYFPAAPQPVAATTDPVKDASANPRTALINKVDTATDHIRGNKNAKITIVEYADTECGYCTRVHTTYKALLEEYPNDVRWVYRHFPFHQNATAEANISECIASVHGEDAFWIYMDGIFTEGAQYSATRGQELATSLGYWNDKVESCVLAQTFEKRIADDNANGIAIGVTGTPYNLIMGPNNIMIPLNGAQPLSVFQSIISQMISK